MMNYLQELFKKQSVDSVVSNLEELSNYSAPYFPGRSTVSIPPTKQILIEEEIYSQIIYPSILHLLDQSGPVPYSISAAPRPLCW